MTGVLSRSKLISESGRKQASTVKMKSRRLLRRVAATAVRMRLMMRVQAWVMATKRSYLAEIHLLITWLILMRSENRAGRRNPAVKRANLSISWRVCLCTRDLLIQAIIIRIYVSVMDLNGGLSSMILWWKSSTSRNSLRNATARKDRLHSRNGASSTLNHLRMLIYFSTSVLSLSLRVLLSPYLLRSNLQAIIRLACRKHSSFKISDRKMTLSQKWTISLTLIISSSFGTLSQLARHFSSLQPLIQATQLLACNSLPVSSSTWSKK